MFEVRGVLEEEHTLSDGARKTNAGWSLILEGLAHCRLRCRKYNSLCCCLASFLCSPLVYRCAQFSSPDPVFSLKVLISPRRPSAGAFQCPQALIHTSHFSLSPYSFSSLPLIESHYVALVWNSLCRLGWPGTHRFPRFCFHSSAGPEVVHHTGSQSFSKQSRLMYPASSHAARACHQRPHTSPPQTHSGTPPH